MLLRREGWQVNHKLVYRQYVEEGWQIRNQRPKRKVSAKLREDRSPASMPNKVWAMDFLSDQLIDGVRIRILTIVDAFSSLSPAIDVRQRHWGTDFVETLESVTLIHDTPKSIQVDQALEFITQDVGLRASSRVATLDF